jgi:NAD(P)-dependent dehydrogenase (short-subunit alcohol dehydrogenase family)
VSSVLSAVEGLTHALALELAPIRVNAVVPSIIRTELWNGLPLHAREGLYASVAAAVPLGRVGERHDVAEAYAYLMTNRTPRARSSPSTVERSWSERGLTEAVGGRAPPWSPRGPAERPAGGAS